MFARIGGFFDRVVSSVESTVSSFQLSKDPEITQQNSTGNSAAVGISMSLPPDPTPRTQERARSSLVERELDFRKGNGLPLCTQMSPVQSNGSPVEIPEETPRSPLTAQQSATCENMFDLISDGKGHLSKEDMTQWFGGYDTTTLDWEVLDKNKNGVIDRDEFEIYWEKTAKRRDFAGAESMTKYMENVQETFIRNKQYRDYTKKKQEEKTLPRVQEQLEESKAEVERLRQQLEEMKQKAEKKEDELG